MCFFKIKFDGKKDDLELEFIDYGLIELENDNEFNHMVMYGEFDSHGRIFQELEDRDIEIIESDFDRIPLNYKTLDEQELQIFNKFIQICNEDDDIQKISHNLQL